MLSSVVALDMYMVVRETTRGVPVESGKALNVAKGGGGARITSTPKYFVD